MKTPVANIRHQSLCLRYALLKQDVGTVFVKGCKYPELVSDGYCNDETNNIHCNFDGGDCCYSCVSKAFCKDCLCLTDNFGEEINYSLIGDGHCHDETNNEKCNYDGGDCCINSTMDYCSECTCYFNETCSDGFHALGSLFLQNLFLNNETVK